MKPFDAIANALRIASGKTERNPSDAAKDAGNYAKGKLAYKGLTIAIENPKGSERSGIGKDGKRWRVTLPASYGYVLGTEGYDKDHVDVYLGPDHASDKVFVVDQVNAENKRFDEHKCMLSYPSKAAALADYEKAFSDGKAKDRIGAVTEMSMDAFKAWVKSKDTKKPLGDIRKGYATGGAVAMPLIKSGSKEAISKNIKTEMGAGGKPQKQAVAIALDVARRAKRAFGGSVSPADEILRGYAGGGDVDFSTEDILAEALRRSEPAPVGLPDYLRGQIQDLKRGEGAYADDVRPRQAESFGTLGDIAGFGAELTGVPSMVRGAGNMRRGWDEGSVLRGGAGLGEFLLGATPGAMVVGGPARAAVNTVMPNLPAALGVTAGLGFPAAYLSDSEAASKGAASAIDKDPEIQSLRKELDKLLDERIKASSGVVKGLGAASADKARERADAAYAKRIEDTEKKLTAAEDRARKAYGENAPFRERNPGAAQTIAGLGVGTAAGWGAAKGMAKALGDKARGKAVDAAAADVRTQLGALGRGEGSAFEAAAAQDLLRRRLNSLDSKNSLFNKGYQTVGNAGKGFILGAEASSLPEQIDYVTFDPGHPTRERAVEVFTKPDYWKERLMPAVLGGSAAHLGMLGGKGVGNFVSGGYKPDMDKARSMASWGDEPSTTERVMAKISGREAMGPSDIALDRIKRHQEAVARAEAPTLAAAEQSRQAREASRGIAQGEAEALGRTSGLKALEDQSGAAGRPGPSPTSEAASSPTSVPPKSGIEGSAIDDALQSRLSVPEQPTIYVKTPRKSGGWHIRKEDGKFASHPSKKGKDEPESGKKSGGAVGSALDTARKYAAGGAVLAGPVIGETGGREDALPVDVGHGSYVIPSDCVSACGGGNSLAGMKKLEETFGKSAPKPRAAGGAIPIMISDGEFVLAPEQVAKLGGGDMDKGHKVLDALVKKLRQEHIATLKSLPGPAKG